MALTTFVSGQVLTAQELNDSFAAVSGLRLIKTQTIGTAVSSVTVSDVFSATYDNYFITVSGGAGSTGAALLLTLGATATGYYSAGAYVTYASSNVTGTNSSNGTSWNVGSMSTGTLSAAVYLQNPFNTEESVFSIINGETQTGGLAVFRGGYLNNTTSYTACTFTTSSGTMTGGTVRVYGYQNS